MKEKKWSLPPIGFRIIKSAVGIFLCYIVNELRHGQGIVFYSQLAVLWCMQDYISETKKNAKQRFLGTVVGALFGLVYIMLEQCVQISSDLVRGLAMALFIVFVLYFTVLIKKKQASYFSCVVFLSIAVNHVTDSNPYLFVWNRFLDTAIGIILGIVVNTFSLPKQKHSEILFVSGLDDTLLSKQNNMTDFGRVELNRMIEEGMMFTVSTMRTPASLIEPMKDIRLHLPVIVMDGAALYNLKDKSYERVYVISSNLSGRIASLFEEMHVNYFANVVVDDLLMIYYQDSDNTTYNDIVQTLRSSLYRNYIKRPLPANEDVVYFMLIDDTETIHNIYDALSKQEFYSQIKILCYESHDYPGKSYIKIYNRNASKENMLEYLQNELDIERVVTYGTIEGKYTHTIVPGDSNGLIRMMKREFEPIRFLQ